MKRLEALDIFIKDAVIEVKKLDFTNPDIAKLFEDTKKRQKKLIDLKEVDQEQLKLIVQR